MIFCIFRLSERDFSSSIHLISLLQVYFQNIIHAVVILAIVAMARPQASGRARQFLRLESRQDIQGPLTCDDFGNNQNCPGRSSLCCLEGSLCLLDTDQQGQALYNASEQDLPASAS
jgi:hypothetical protein